MAQYSFAQAIGSALRAQLITAGFPAGNITVRYGDPYSGIGKIDTLYGLDPDMSGMPKITDPFESFNAMADSMNVEGMAAQLDHWLDVAKSFDSMRGEGFLPLLVAAGLATEAGGLTVAGSVTLTGAGIIGGYLFGRFADSATSGSADADNDGYPDDIDDYPNDPDFQILGRKEDEQPSQGGPDRTEKELERGKGPNESRPDKPDEEENEAPGTGESSEDFMLIDSDGDGIPDDLDPRPMDGPGANVMASLYEANGITAKSFAFEKTEVMLTIDASKEGFALGVSLSQGGGTETYVMRAIRPQ